MIARIAPAATAAPAPPPPASLVPTLDRDGVMLALAAREQALKTVSGEIDVRFVDLGPRDRQIRIGDRTVSAASFDAVCGFLDVPAGWMGHAPIDLANDVAERMLREERVADRRLIFDERGGVVVGTRSKDEELVPASRVMERVFAALPETDAIVFRETPTAVDLSVVCRSLEIVPKKGDVVRGGLSCLYSEVDQKHSSIRAYSERLVCTNGMVHRDFERIFGLTDDFMEQIGAMVHACSEYVTTALEPKMKRAATFEVNGPQAIRRIFRASRLPVRYLDDVLAAHAVEDDGTAFGVLQAFTRAANSVRGAARARLQSVAGDELLVVDRAHCPSCYATL